jgi:Arc/MetJ-type ribon-helix-helix transcriptional regulator
MIYLDYKSDDTNARPHWNSRVEPPCLKSYRRSYCPMPAAKVAISIDPRLLRHVDRLVRTRIFRTRSQAIQTAVQEKLARVEKSRLARECAKLSKREEVCWAELGLKADAREWPKY